MRKFLIIFSFFFLLFITGFVGADELTNKEGQNKKKDGRREQFLEKENSSGRLKTLNVERIVKIDNGNSKIKTNSNQTKWSWFYPLQQDRILLFAQILAMLLFFLIPFIYDLYITSIKRYNSQRLVDELSFTRIVWVYPILIVLGLFIILFFGFKDASVGVFGSLFLWAIIILLTIYAFRYFGKLINISSPEGILEILSLYFDSLLSKKNKESKMSNCILMYGDFLEKEALDQNEEVCSEGLKKFCSFLKDLGGNHDDIFWKKESILNVVLKQYERVYLVDIKKGGSGIIKAVEENIEEIIELLRKSNLWNITTLDSMIYVTRRMSFESFRLDKGSHLLSYGWLLRDGFYNDHISTMPVDGFVQCSKALLHNLQLLIQHKQVACFSGFIKCSGYLDLMPDSQLLYSIINERIGCDLDLEENRKIYDKKGFEVQKKKVEGFCEKHSQEITLEQKEAIIHYKRSWWKFNELQNIVFLLGAYALHKKAYWTVCILYKQWKEGDSYTSPEILPTSTQQIFDIYWAVRFRGEDSLDEDDQFSESIHEYFVLTLLIFYKKVGENPAFDFPNISFEQYTIVQCDFIISTIKWIESAGLIEKIKGNTELLHELDLTFDDSELKFISKFLQQIKTDAQEKITIEHQEKPLDLDRIEKFKAEVARTLKKEATIRQVVQFFNCGEDVETSVEKGVSICINKIDERAIFFDKWNVYFGALGNGSGRSLAFGENERLILEMLENISAERIPKEELEKQDVDWINQIIFSHRSAIYRIKEIPYKPKYLFSENNAKEFQMYEKVSAFVGFFTIKKIKVPVFEFNIPAFKDLFFVVDKTKIGEINIQKSDDEKEGFEFQDGVFFKLKDFSKDEEALKQIFERFPNFLAGYDTKKKKEEFLKIKVWIEMYEKIEYIPKEKPIGFKVVL